MISAIHQLLSITCPIFISIGIGYIAIKKQLLPKEHLRGLSLFVLNFSLPALVFSAIYDRQLSAIFNPSYVLSYLLGSAICIVLSWALAYRQTRNKLKSSLISLGSSYSNTAFIGLPIALNLLGAKAMGGVAVTLILETTLILPAFTSILNGNYWESTSSQAHWIKRFFKNPLLLSALLGLLFPFSYIKLPMPIIETLSLFSNAASATSLFAIGGILASINTTAILKHGFFISIFKLVIHPLCVALVILLLPNFDRTLQMTAILLACMPTFSMFPIIGHRYQEENLCATALLTTTIFSFLTINVVLWAFAYLF